MHNQHFQPLSPDQLESVDGGFVPFVVFGVYVSAKTVAIVAGAAAASLTYAITH